MSTYNADLCEAIRRHCEQQQWYGPDSDKGLYPRHSRRPNVAPDSLVFYRQEPSLEMWVEHWLQDRMQHWCEWGEEIEQKKLVL